MSSESGDFYARQLYLRSMNEVIEAIPEFIQPVSFEEYLQNRMLRSAVERYLLILTEASIRLGDALPVLYPGVDPRKLRNMGNFLRHMYDHIDDRIVWDSVNNDLPGLKLSVEQALTFLHRNDLPS